MPIKPEEALSVFGFEKLDTFEKVEDLKAEFDKKFIARDRVAEDDEISSQMTGRLFGTLATDIKKEFKKAGIEFDSAEVDIKNKKAGQIVEIGIGKIVNSYQEQINALKAAGNGESTKEIEKLQAKIEKMKTDLKQENELRQKALEENEQLKTGFEGKLKSMKIDQYADDLFSKVKYKNGLSEKQAEVMKTGFKAAFFNEHKFDLDEAGKLLVLNKEGKRIESKTKAGQTLEPFDAVKQFAVQQDVWEDNPRGNQPVKTTSTGSPNGEQKRNLHPSLQGLG